MATRVFSKQSSVRAVISASVAALGHLSGCSRPQPPNIMIATATCDSVPPPLRSGERVGGELPPGVLAIADNGAVVGVVLQARTGRPLQGASVWLGPVGTRVASTPVGRALSNPAGGFALRSVRPGTYTLRTMLIGHFPRE